MGFALLWLLQDYLTILLGGRMQVPELFLLGIVLRLLTVESEDRLWAIWGAFAGGLLSLTLMCLLSRDKKISPVTVSMVGGVSHNVGQVAMAMLVLGAPQQMLYYMGILILVGLACGLATGVAANSVMKHLKAARWRVTPGEEDRKTSVILVVLALIVVASGLFFAWRAMRRTVPVEVLPVEEDSGVQLLTDGDLPFNLP